MKLNESKGNMYEFITHTGNIIKGACFHNCSYCYMKRWGKLKPIRFDEKEIKGNTKEGNFIFVGSSTDMFADNIPSEWIFKVLDYLSKFDNKYLFQTKNPMNIIPYLKNFPKHSTFCTTIETDEYYPEIMGRCPTPENRAFAMRRISEYGYATFATIEPIMDFGMYNFIELIKPCNFKQVNVGFDSGKNNIAEPSKEKTEELIYELRKFTTVHIKKNAKRILGYCD